MAKVSVSPKADNLGKMSTWLTFLFGLAIGSLLYSAVALYLIRLRNVELRRNRRFLIRIQDLKRRLQTRDNRVLQLEKVLGETEPKAEKVEQEEKKLHFKRV